ncbi:MAG TPA: FAD-binding oxidoreductase [Beijerinckiaceae bacterium]
MTAAMRSDPLSAIDHVRAAIGDVPCMDDPVTVRRKSRDYFWYSPVLNERLAGKVAELVVAPRDEADVLRVAAACARHGVPITPRGGGTGNYGQAVPLAGGVVLDMTSMTRIHAVSPGRVSVEPGAKLVDVDAQIRAEGWELRMHPSTKRTATVGGFVAGGSGGVGSVTYGGLREPGNVLGARVVTMEPEPRVITLDAEAAQKINRAYGTTGLITRLDMPLAPAWEWVDVAVAFDDFMKAVRVGREIAMADGVVKKLVTVFQAPLPTYFGPLAKLTPPGGSLMICMIAAPFLACFHDLLAGRGAVVHQEPFDESPGHTPIYEYAWNHTTLQVLKVDRGVTYLQCLYPADSVVESIELMTKTFADEQMQHIEFIRFAGKLTASSIPVLRYRSAERLDEIIAFHERNGVMVANPHVYTLEDGSRHKRADADQLGFKQEVDPAGLLNPGKMRSFQPRA